MTEVSGSFSDAIMQTIWEDIKDGGIPFYILILLITFFYIREPLKSSFSTIFGIFTDRMKSHRKEYTKKQVLSHPIFNDLDFWIEVGIDAISLSTITARFPITFEHKEDEDYLTAKEQIAKDILKIKFMDIRDSLKSFLEENDLDSIDMDILKRYILTLVSKCKIKQHSDMKEAGIPDIFLSKYAIYEKLSEDMLFSTLDTFLDKNAFDLSIPSRTYLAFNIIDRYLNDMFTTIAQAIVSINGDLHGIEYKGEVIGGKKEKRLEPPHATFKNSADNILNKIMSKYGASRAYVIKYYEVEGSLKHSCVYEVCDKGIMPYIETLQGILDDYSEDLISILNKGDIVVANIGNFNNHIIEHLTQRGVDGIIISPIKINDKLEGAFVLDYISKEEFDKHAEDKNIEADCKEVSEELMPYIDYPTNYKYE